jgi:hypothetical protein
MQAENFSNKNDLDAEDTQSLIKYFWDRQLARKFATESIYMGAEQFNLKQLPKKSDTLFILGCGSSINNISDSQWKDISENDSLGVNYFYVHPFKPNFHMIELGQSKLSMDCLNKFLLSDAERKNEHVLVQIRHLLMRDEVYLNNDHKNLRFYSPSVPKSRSHIMLERLLQKFYRTRQLIHHASNLDCAIHLAFLMGYKKVVLLGVDLNSNEYFWEKSNEVNDAFDAIQDAVEDDYKIAQFEIDKKAMHATDSEESAKKCNSLTITDYLKIVYGEFEKENQQLLNGNPTSRLTSILPSYAFGDDCEK